MGTLPDDFPRLQRLHIGLDRDTISDHAVGAHATLISVLRPARGGAPCRSGRQGGREPREYGGNIDCKELTAGSTIYLPVWTRRADCS